MTILVGHAVILALWWLLMRARGRAEAEHLRAMRALDAEHAARNAAFLRTIEGILTARALPTHQPDHRPS